MARNHAFMRDFRVTRSRNDIATLNMPTWSDRSSASVRISQSDDQALFDFFLAEEFDFGFRTGRSQNADKPRTWQQKCQQQKREGNPVAFPGV